MDSNYTDRAREIITKASDLASLNLNSTIELEHLLSAILESKSILNKILKADQISAINSKVSTIISKFGKIQTSSKPLISQNLAQLLNDAKREARDHISVPLLIFLLLKYSSIAKLFPNPEEIIKKIEKELKSKNMDNQFADDPEDKMSKFAVEMVEQARNNKYFPLIGRDDELRQLMETIQKKNKSNAILVGHPGVGKTAIVAGLAQKIANGEAMSLQDYKIYNVDLSAMVAGTSFRGQFEERLKGLVKEAEENQKTILFIDEIHMILGAGKGEGAMDAANILKPGLADGSLKVIGATTYDEYRKYITKDPAFERRFTLVKVKESSIEDTITILRGLREKFESHHGCKISDKAIVYASTMGRRYIPNRRMPDLALDLVDTACASQIISLNSEPLEIENLKGRIWGLELEKTCYEMDVNRDPSVRKDLEIVERKIAEAKEELKPLEEKFNAENRDLLKAKDLKKKLEDAKYRVEQARREGNKYTVYDISTNIIPAYERDLEKLSEREKVIEPFHIAEILSRFTGIPVKKLTIKENQKLLNMGNKIKEIIFGQNEAVDTIVASILASRIGLNDENRPIGSFLLLGPTGVGKTELSKAISMELNDTCDNMVVLDMSEYMNETSLNKLIGVSAGYVGYEDSGTLTEPVKQMPYCVVLLDEVDMAHQSCLNILFQILDEGRATDGKGVKVNFKNTVVIMTSNLGQEFITPNGIDRASIEAKVLARFGHPFINRIDNLVIFNNLSKEAMVNIFYKELKELNKRLSDKKVKLEVSNDVINYAVETGANSNFGARILKRFVKDKLVNPLTQIILSQPSEEPLDVSCHLNYENQEGILFGEMTFALKQRN